MIKNRLICLAIPSAPPEESLPIPSAPPCEESSTG
jgi:hypothetical protein